MLSIMMKLMHNWPLTLLLTVWVSAVANAADHKSHQAFPANPFVNRPFNALHDNEPTVGSLMNHLHYGRLAKPSSKAKSLVGRWDRLATFRSPPTLRTVPVRDGLDAQAECNLAIREEMRHLNDQTVHWSNRVLMPNDRQHIKRVAQYRATTEAIRGWLNRETMAERRQAALVGAALADDTIQRLMVEALRAEPDAAFRRSPDGTRYRNPMQLTLARVSVKSELLGLLERLWMESPLLQSTIEQLVAETSKDKTLSILSEATRGYVAQQLLHYPTLLEQAMHRRVNERWFTAMSEQQEGAMDKAKLLCTMLTEHPSFLRQAISTLLADQQQRQQLVHQLLKRREYRPALTRLLLEDGNPEQRTARLLVQHACQLTSAARALIVQLEQHPPAQNALLELVVSPGFAHDLLVERIDTEARYWAVLQEMAVANDEHGHQTVRGPRLLDAIQQRHGRTRQLTSLAKQEKDRELRAAFAERVEEDLQWLALSRPQHPQKSTMNSVTDALYQLQRRLHNDSSLQDNFQYSVKQCSDYLQSKVVIAEFVCTLVHHPHVQVADGADGRASPPAHYRCATTMSFAQYLLH